MPLPMRSNSLICLLISGALLLAACGYIESGTWEDDQNNWIRAFREKQPPAIAVVHSSYMSTPHWSDEYEYFFLIKGGESAHQYFFERAALVPYSEKADLRMPVDSFFQTKPEWFLPKELSAYDIWIRKEEPRGAFRIFIDRVTGEWFVTDNQI